MVLFAGYARKWAMWAMLPLCILALWSCSALLVQRFVFNINGVPALPTQTFLRSGKGRVLDMGAGTGRSTIMVLNARPDTTIVAVDLFGESFEQHFGKNASPQQKLLRNLKAAGVDDRVTIQAADVRTLPFGPGEFDGIVSAYTIDHLGRKGADEALGEASRVLKPGGDFLLILLANDAWAKYVFGPLIMHAGLRGAPWWSAHLEKAGFHVLEQGTRPVTLYFLARRT